MPRIIEYNVVQERMKEAGFVSLYHNSGAFGFAAGHATACGWIGPDDPTIRDAARLRMRQFPPPYGESLAAALGRALPHLPGDAWLMPKSHWHYELHFGNKELLESLLPVIGIDPELLRELNNGSAIEFSTDERALLQRAVGVLMDGLIGSDFLIAFPDAQTVCTIHHHKQLWWQTTDASIATAVHSPSF